jgi:hypothetical protein
MNCKICGGPIEMNPFIEEGIDHHYTPNLCISYLKEELEKRLERYQIESMIEEYMDKHRYRDH